MMEVLPVKVVGRDDKDADLVIAGVFEGEAPDLGGLGPEVKAAVERLAARAGWKGKEEQVAQTDLGAGGPVVLLSGLGKRADFSSVRAASWIFRIAEQARGNGFPRLLFLPPRHEETGGRAAAERTVRWMALAGYRFDRRSEESGGGGAGVERVSVAPPAGEEEAYRAAVDVSRAVAEAVAFTRNLANTPPNEATTLWMVERAREMAEARGAEVTVLDEDELRARGMGGILAVGSGSANPPRLVRLAWGGSGPRLALVGKGVTFDTGGISIKPAASMEEMKYDKAGACAVLGAFRAAVDLGLPVRLRAYVPFVENMPGHNAYRPGDIVRFHNGKSVEITNTDAEGRLILADAMSWAAAEEPEALLELSTLTGGVVVALGSQAAGLFTPDDELAAQLLAASSAAGERFWRLPLYPEYLEDMKGVHADLRNSAGRAASACTAAAFLSQFVGEMKSWAHLDIAGVAYLPLDPKVKGAGSTGFGVASTLAWLRQRAGQAG